MFPVQGENKGKVVLEGVTGHVRSGEVTAVMGPSGAGKTTFLNTLSGKAYYGVSLCFPDPSTFFEKWNT